MNTRAARPETLAAMAELVGEVCHQRLEIANPAFWQTKAEMSRAASDDLLPLMRASVSCDGGFTRRVQVGQLCGTCTSCLLRRQALIAGGREAVDKADLERMPGDGLAAPREHAHPMVLSMLMQAADIDRCLRAPHAWDSLVDKFPTLISVRRATGGSAERIVDLLARYVDDWRRVPYSLVRSFLPEDDLAQ